MTSAQLSHQARMIAQRAQRLLERLANAPKVLLPKAEQDVNQKRMMEAIINDRFVSEARHGPGSIGWRNLKPATWARKRGPGILRESGMMFRQAMSAVRGSFSLRGPTSFSSRMGRMTVPYARVHQDGGRNIPARPYLLDPTNRELSPAAIMARRSVEDGLDRIVR